MGKARIKHKNEPTPKSSWPFVVIGVGALLIIVVGFLAWRGGTSSAKSASATPQVTGGPKLSVDRDSIDFGKLPLDQTVRAEFKLKNIGDQPLRIVGEPRVELVKGC